MENCQFCSDSEKVFCSQCVQNYCTHCGITHHLSEPLKLHTMTYVCAECEEETAVKFCENCDQSLCQACDTRIHNKGKRAQHVKKDISETINLKKVSNLVFITSAFYDEQFTADSDSDAVKTKLSDLLADINLKANNEGNRNKVSLFMIESKQNSQESEQNLLVEAMSELKIKNIVLLKDSFEEFGQSGFNRHITNIPAQDNKRASAITFVLRFLDGAQSIHLYDTTRNEDLALALEENFGLKTMKIFVNMDSFGQKVLETSLFEQQQQPTVLKEKIILPNSSPAVSEEIRAENFFLGNNQQLYSFQSLPRQEPSFNSFEAVPKGKSRGAYAISGNCKENVEPNFPLFKFPGSTDCTNQRSSANSSFSLETSKRGIVVEAQPLHYVDIQGSTRASEMFQRDLIRFANNGELLILKETVVSRLVEMFKLRSEADANTILREAESKRIIHTTIRKFLDNEPIYYIGMLLNTLTIESLIWTIKSIRNDMMTPTEKLVLSRVKECYGLKIDQNYWKQIIEFISSKQSPILDFNTGKAQKTQAYPIYVKQILDPVTNLETNALYITNEDWVPEDQGVVDDTSYEWKTFAMFIEDFFREDTHSAHDEQKSSASSSRWNNSVENVLSRSACDQEIGLKVSDDVKAIPGGRYGCAQFIKYCGPDNLKALSVGRLTLLVQEALNKGILRYQRTLLVKNTTGENFANTPSQSGFEAEVLHSINVERRTKLLSMVKEALLQILMENPNGVALAQIPSHLKRKLRCNVDFQELGFPKLKNFLSTLQNLVVMESVGTNHTNVKLRGPIPRQTPGMMSKPMDGKRRAGDIDNMSNASTRFNTPKGLEQVSGHSTPMTMVNTPMAIGSTPMARGVNEMWKITQVLESVLKQYPQGIAMQDLHMRLCEQLKANINFQDLGYSRFYDFLVDQAEQFAAIEAKKDTFVVYPKMASFWQKGNNNMMTPPSVHNRPSHFNGIAHHHEQTGRATDPKAYQKMMAQAGSNPPGLLKFQTPNAHKNYPLSFNNSVNLSDNNMSYMSQNNNNNKSNDKFFNSPNMLNLSSIIVSDNKASKAMTPGIARGPKFSNMNVTTCNLNFNNSMDADMGDKGAWPFSATHNKGPKFSKFRVQEESHLEIQDNLRFIEELLKDNDVEKKMMNACERSATLSLGGVTPNQSFNGKPN